MEGKGGRWYVRCACLRADSMRRFRTLVAIGALQWPAVGMRVAAVEGSGREQWPDSASTATYVPLSPLRRVQLPANEPIRAAMRTGQISWH